MTQKYFWTDPYCTTHETLVSSVNKALVVLESTIFFAFSGGQESDQGTINDVSVLSAQKDGVDIVYTLAAAHGFSVGQRVRVCIDWTRRYRLMRLHFAAELVLELLSKQVDGIVKIGAHIAPHGARIDFAWPNNISPLLPQIAEQANVIICSNAEIRTGFENETTERRYWEIDGLARVPCGGTHVRRTGEVGAIRLKRENIGKGKERVEIRLLEH